MKKTPRIDVDSDGNPILVTKEYDLEFGGTYEKVKTLTPEDIERLSSEIMRHTKS